MIEMSSVCSTCHLEATNGNGKLFINRSTIINLVLMYSTITLFALTSSRIARYLMYMLTTTSALIILDEYNEIIAINP